MLQQFKQICEYPRVNMSRLLHCVPLAQGIFSVFKSKAGCIEDQETTSHQISRDARSSSAHKEGSVPKDPLRNLEKAAVESGIISNWQPCDWQKVRTLATAASGDGSVELMISRENPDQTVAVKTLPKNLIRSSPDEFNQKCYDLGERPWVDIALVKHLNEFSFPFGCELLGVFLSSDHVRIVTSFANRGDLFTWVQADKSAAGVEREAEMRPILTQVFTAVRSLHDLGIAHRDLSLENVMLTDGQEGELQVKIIDYGMASMSRTAIREVRGKRSYQAPEMFERYEYDTFLADSFAIGVIVFCMAVHSYPWNYTKPGKDFSCDMARAKGLDVFLQKKRLQCCKKPVAEVFSKSYVELVHGLLAFDPEARYSLGEACFENSSISRLNAKTFLARGISTLSDVSTAASLAAIEDKAPREDDKPDGKKADDVQSRSSVWNCDWLRC